MQAIRGVFVVSARGLCLRPAAEQVRPCLRPISPKQVAAAKRYLETLEPSKMERASSYALQLQAGRRISNGALILAAVELGLEVRPMRLRFMKTRFSSDAWIYVKPKA